MSYGFMLPGGELDAPKLRLASAVPSHVLAGDTFYAGTKVLQTGTFDGWLVVDLGTGTSFNVSGYPGYESFTAANFIIEPIAHTQTHGNYTINDSKSYYAKNVSTVTKSYNASTGILTAYERWVTSIGNTDGWNPGSTTNETVHAYLKYKPQ